MLYLDAGRVHGERATGDSPDAASWHRSALFVTILPQPRLLAMHGYHASRSDEAI